MVSLPLPVAVIPARFPEDGWEGAGVPWVHGRIEHDLDAAGGDQQVAVRIAPAHAGVGAAGDALPFCRAAVRGEAAQIGRRDVRPAQICGRGNARAAAVPPASLAGRGSEQLVGAGEIGRADLHPAVDLEAEQHAVERHAPHERFCSVDRVDEPAVARPSGARAAALGDAEFLADDGVSWVGLLDAAADELFGQAVGHSDGRVVRLEIGQHARAEIAQREPSGQVGGLRGETHVPVQ